MARRRRARLTPDLFPFLNIVVCVIGVLAFLIAVLTTVGAEQGDAARAHADLSAAVAERRATADRLAGLLARDAALVESIEQAAEAVRLGAAASAELERLEAEVRALRARLADARTPGADLAGLSDLFSRKQKAAAEAAALEAELSRLKTSMVDAAAKAGQAGGGGEEQSVRIVFPASGNKGLKPVFVECAATGLTVYPEASTIAKAQVARSAAYRALLDRVKADDTLTLNFLVRPDGVETFAQARQIARDRSVRYGYVPAPGSGRITISDGSPAKP